MSLIVTLGTLRLDVLLNRVNLTLVANQALLDLVQPVVDVTLQNLVLPSFVLHGTVICLLAQLRLVAFYQLFNDYEPRLFLLELTCEVVDLHEFVLHLVLHLVDALSDRLHFLVNTALQAPNLI